MFKSFDDYVLEMDLASQQQFTNPLQQQKQQSPSPQMNPQLNILANQAKAEINKTKNMLAQKTDPKIMQQQIQNVQKIKQQLDQLNAQKTIDSTQQAVSQATQN